MAFKTYYCIDNVCVLRVRRSCSQKCDRARNADKLFKLKMCKIPSRGCQGKNSVLFGIITAAGCETM